MSEALKILNNIRTLRAQARECTLETLEEMLEKLEVVVNERREEESAAAAEVEERTRKLQQYREMLIADGIDPNELLNSLAAVKSGTKDTFCSNGCILAGNVRHYGPEKRLFPWCSGRVFSQIRK